MPEDITKQLEAELAATEAEKAKKERGATARRVAYDATEAAEKERIRQEREDKEKQLIAQIKKTAPPAETAPRAAPAKKSPEQEFLPEDLRNLTAYQTERAALTDGKLKPADTRKKIAAAQNPQIRSALDLALKDYQKSRPKKVAVKKPTPAEAAPAPALESAVPIVPAVEIAPATPASAAPAPETQPVAPAPIPEVKTEASPVAPPSPAAETPPAVETATEELVFEEPVIVSTETVPPTPVPATTVPSLAELAAEELGTTPPQPPAVETKPAPVAPPVEATPPTPETAPAAPPPGPEAGPAPAAAAPPPPAGETQPRADADALFKQEQLRKKIRFLGEAEHLDPKKIRELFATEGEGKTLLFRNVIDRILRQENTAKADSIKEMAEILAPAGYNFSADEYEQLYDALVAYRDEQAKMTDEKRFLPTEQGGKGEKKGFWRRFLKPQFKGRLTGLGAGLAKYGGIGMAASVIATPVAGIIVTGLTRVIEKLYSHKIDDDAIRRYSQETLGDETETGRRKIEEKFAAMLAGMRERQLKILEAGGVPEILQTRASRLFDKFRENLKDGSLAEDTKGLTPEQKDLLAQKMAALYAVDDEIDVQPVPRRERRPWWRRSLRSIFRRDLGDEQADAAAGVVTGTLLTTAVRAAGQMGGVGYWVSGALGALGGMRGGEAWEQGRKETGEVLVPIQAAQKAMAEISARLARPAALGGGAEAAPAPTLTTLDVISGQLENASAAARRLLEGGALDRTRYAELRKQIEQARAEYILLRADALTAQGEDRLRRQIETFLTSEEARIGRARTEREQRERLRRRHVMYARCVGAAAGAAVALCLPFAVSEAQELASEIWQKLFGEAVPGAAVAAGAGGAVAAGGAEGHGVTEHGAAGGESAPGPAEFRPTEDMFVHKGEGLTHPLERQLEAQGLSHHDAVLQARNIAIREGWIRPDGSETWVRTEDITAVRLNPDNSVTLIGATTPQEQLYEVGSVQAAHATAVESGAQDHFEELVTEKLPANADRFYATGADNGTFHYTVDGQDHLFTVEDGAITAMDSKELTTAIDLHAADVQSQFNALVAPHAAEATVAVSEQQVLAGAGPEIKLEEIKVEGELLPLPETPDQIVPEHITADNVVYYFPDGEVYFGATAIHTSSHNFGEFREMSVNEFVQEYKDGGFLGLFGGWKQDLAKHIQDHCAGALSRNPNTELEDFINLNPEGFKTK